MRKILCICILLFIAGCTEKRSTKSEQITAYYEGFKNSDYNRIKRTISDSLTIIEGDTMTYTPESYYNHFKWDSVFKPAYNLVALENRDDDDKIVATVSVNSVRFEFLKNNPLTCRYKFHFESGKITRIENLDCDANWEMWQKERDALVNWVKFNRPELDGFINDLSMEGAIDYLHAIALYKKRKVKGKE